MHKKPAGARDYRSESVTAIHTSASKSFLRTGWKTFEQPQMASEEFMGSLLMT